MVATDPCGVASAPTESPASAAYTAGPGRPSAPASTTLAGRLLTAPAAAAAAAARMSSAPGDAAVPRLRRTPAARARLTANTAGTPPPEPPGGPGRGRGL